MSSDDLNARAVNQIGNVSKLLREAIAATLPVAHEQYLTIAIPGTIIDVRDIEDGGTFVYDLEKTAFPPMQVQQAEASLVDNMIPLSTVMIGNTGKSVARSYGRALDVLVPSPTGHTRSPDHDEYKQAMEYLTMQMEDTGKTPVDTYIEKQDAWRKAQDAWDSAKLQAKNDAKNKYPSNTVAERAYYDEWNQAHFRKYKSAVQGRYMDWVTNGNKFEVERKFAVVDIVDIMTRIENSKESLRNSSIVDEDGVNEVQLVSLTPKNWAGLCKQKVEGWYKKNGEYSLNQLNAEILRLESICASYNVLLNHVQGEPTYPYHFSIKDGTSTDGDNTAGDKTSGDKTSGDKTADDKASGDKTADDKTAGDKTSGDKTSGDKTSGDKTSGDKTSGDKTSGDKTADDKTADDKTSGDKTADDKTAGDNTSGDETSIPRRHWDEAHKSLETAFDAFYGAQANWNTAMKTVNETTDEEKKKDLKATADKEYGAACDAFIKRINEFKNGRSTTAKSDLTKWTDDTKTGAVQWVKETISKLERNIEALEKKRGKKIDFYDKIPVIEGATKEGALMLSPGAEEPNPLFGVEPKSATEAAGTADPWVHITASISAKDQKSTANSSSLDVSVGASGSVGLWSLGGSFAHSSASTNMSNDMAACDVTVSFQALLVNIRRPWLHGELFSDMELDTARDHYLSPGAQKLHQWMKDQNGSSSAAGPATDKLADYSLFPAYPTSFIVAADTCIEFTGNTQHIEEHMSSSSTSASVSVGWGPWAVNSSVSHREKNQSIQMQSTATGCKLCFSAPQIIGWVSQILPALPRN